MKRYTKAIIISIIGLLLIGTASLAVIGMNYRPPVAVSAVILQPPTVAELLKLVNEERAKNNVAPLVLDDRLNQSAQKKADDMAKYNYFGHVSPNDGRHGYEYINDVGITCKTDSENLRENGDVNTSFAVMGSWINSSPHHLAMINPDYTQTGFGINGNLVVEHFCQP